MRISECLTVERCGFTDGETKHEAVNDVIEWLATSPDVTDSHELTQAVWRREGLMSTGIGMGIAVPHVRIDSVRRLVMAVGIQREGLPDYGTIDGKPVYIIVLIAAGREQHTDYIQALSQVVDLLKRDETRESLLRAQTPEEIHALLTAEKAL
jgi:mannitol/fructose-specific phosphotransferase system IIA component (Ntr-type)